MIPNHRREDGYPVHIEPCPRRVRAVFGGETVAESARCQLMLERGTTPVYYFPKDGVRMDLMTRTDHSTV